MSKWDGIEEFVAVAEAGGFTAGAKTLGRSLTHVSRAIQLLEQRLQTRLFERTTRTVHLTDTGRVFFERCRRIAEEHDEAIALISERGEPQGELRITCSHAIGERFVAPILRRFVMRWPKLQLSIDLSNRVVDLFDEGYDLAIRTGPSTDPRLIARQIASRTLYTCASPEYLARTGRPLLVDDLLRHECVLGTSTTWHFDVNGQEVLYHPKGRFRCNSGYTAMEACLAGMGVCQLPDFYILSHLKAGNVELVLEDARPADEPIWAVYPRQRHLQPKIKILVECLHQELAPAIRGATTGTFSFATHPDSPADRRPART